jgi:hypothetical protein
MISQPVLVLNRCDSTMHLGIAHARYYYTINLIFVIRSIFVISIFLINQERDRHYRQPPSNMQNYSYII